MLTLHTISFIYLSLILDNPGNTHYLRIYRYIFILLYKYTNYYFSIILSILLYISYIYIQIVIDSIAALVRKDNLSGTDKDDYLFGLTAML